MNNGIGHFFEKMASSAALKTLEYVSRKSTIMSRTDQDRLFDRVSFLKNSFDISTSKQALQSFDNISFVGSMATRRASAAAKYRIVTCDSSGEVIENTNTQALLDNPMPRHKVSAHEWRKIVYLHYLLDGNVFVVDEEVNMYNRIHGLIGELKVVNPIDVYVRDIYRTTVKATTRRRNELCDYEMYWDHNPDYLLPDEVFHIKMLGPYNVLRGMGIPQQNSSLLENDKIKDVFDRTFFEWGPLAKLAFTNRKATDTDRRKTEERLLEDYGRNKKPFLVMRGEWDVHNLDIKYDELKMLDQALFSRENVASMFEVPRRYAGLEAQYATKEDDALRWDEVIEGDGRAICSGLKPLAEKLDGPNVFLKLDKESIFDVEKRLKVSESGIRNHWLVPSEVRKKFGWGKHKDVIDKPLYPLNLTTTIDDFDISTLADGDKSAKSGECSCGCSTKKEDEDIPVEDRGQPWQLGIHETQQAVKAEAAKKIIKKINQYFRGAEKRALDLLDAGQLKTIDNVVFAGEEYFKTAKNMHVAAITVSVNGLSEVFDAALDTSFANLNFKLAVERLATNYVSETINKRRDELKMILKTSLDDDLSAIEIKETIQNYFKEYKGAEGWRAKRIARTEAFRAHDQAAKVVYKDLGVDKVDLVGCTALEPAFDCNIRGVDTDMLDTVNRHPNCTGTFVPEKRPRGG